ncbi:hypothetical protein [Isoptericola sp. NPDC056605]|uniref:hypothetical protein n=1 Tax=Isoptericola sp. NPDC056605 TaxID=3345876 RepID=UPI0036BBF126
MDTTTRRTMTETALARANVETINDETMITVLRERARHAYPDERAHRNGLTTTYIYADGPDMVAGVLPGTYVLEETEHGQTACYRFTDRYDAYDVVVARSLDAQLDDARVHP